jgi:glutamate synthase domain-containing protein 1
MLRGIAKEGKTVLRAHMVRIGDTKMRAKTKSTMRTIEDVFIVRSIKELTVLSRTHPHGIVSQTVWEV